MSIVPFLPGAMHDVGHITMIHAERLICNFIGATICDDENDCTVDSCDPQIGCQSTPLTSAELEALCGAPPIGQQQCCDMDTGCFLAPVCP